eukprot:scaffold27391_cov20-Tisochrysis_lutea.AAC.2
MMDLNAVASLATVLGTSLLFKQDLDKKFDKLNHKMDETRRDSDKKFDGVNHKFDEMRRDSDQ